MATTPAKATGTRKKASAKLPHGKAKAGKVVVRATYEAFGRDDWRLIRPNQIIANELMGAGAGSFDLSKLNDYLAAHLHPDDRKPFFDAAMADPSLDIEGLEEMLEDMAGLVFDIDS